MRTLVPSSSGVFYLDGKPLPLGGEVLIGARLLREFDPRARIPGRNEPPYLFCGNGTCRDCNVSIDGLPDLPSCRLPLATGLSLSGSGEGALPSRIVAPAGESVQCDVLVVGAGEAGEAAAAAARRKLAAVLHVEARHVDREGVRSPCPVAVEGFNLVVFDKGQKRSVMARTIVLATGWRDALPTFPGSTRLGIIPMDLLERYVAHGFLPGETVLLVGRDLRSPKLRTDLVRLGAKRIELASSLLGPLGPSRIDDFEIVAVGGRREPSLSLAKALGCRTYYDHDLRHERLDVTAEGRTSVAAVFGAGGAVGTAGDEVGRAAARCL